MLQRWQDAKLEAAEALVADLRHGKAWYRLGKAYLGANGFTKGMQVLNVAEQIIQDADGKAAVVKLRYDAFKEKGIKTYDIADGEDPPADEEKEVPLESASPHTAARAAQLKSEGQQLTTSTSPNLIAAYAKYTLALVFDPPSALLHAKRAHVANQLELWDQAGIDARTAIRLDGSNAKAWARLGAALYGKKLLQRSSDAFTRALTLLESAPQPLSPANAKLKESVTFSIASIRHGKRPAQNVARVKANNLPWEKAERLLGSARNFVPEDMKTWHTTFWTIVPARENFAKAMEAVYKLEVHPGRGTHGSTDALEYFTNSILIDLRAFGVSRADFNERYKLQVKHELDKSNAFMEDDDDDALFPAVKTRLRQQGGWEGSSAATAPVRKSLETTIRARINAAFRYFALAGDHDSGIWIFERLLSFLERGRKEWGGVPAVQRGPTFDLEFLLGVERMCLDCLRRRYLGHRGMAIPDTAGILEQIKALAEKMLKEISTLAAADRIPNRDTRPPSYILGYIILPEAWAHDSLCFYYFNRSQLTPKREDKVPFLLKAAAHAAKAEKLFPNDDEHHTDTVYQHLTLLFLLQRPLKETLPLCDELAESYERSRAIWDYGKDLSHYGRCQEFAEEARKSLRDGKATLNDVIVPKDLDRLPIDALHL
ncbi:hypothetical protein EXIGLDRAFT_839365 [Exidia glandulosa HHB12029]|uniref:TPR-like protein n=1 Tax=Exidia glandulosa HHB12029 TaxID=1314781 RepID=A0A165F2R0_EXIGL|nr:hypothetical protein EXIGLDRAFT_839365 [Exidia glandulosa HHB12029]